MTAPTCFSAWYTWYYPKMSPSTSPSSVSKRNDCPSNSNKTEVLAQIDPNFLLSHTLLWCAVFTLMDTSMPTPSVGLPRCIFWGARNLLITLVTNGARDTPGYLLGSYASPKRWTCLSTEILRLCNSTMKFKCMNITHLQIQRYHT